MWIYIKEEFVASDPSYLVGFYDPNGKFVEESEWNRRKEARERVNFLNGGTGKE